MTDDRLTGTEALSLAAIVLNRARVNSRRIERNLADARRNVADARNRYADGAEGLAVNLAGGFLANVRGYAEGLLAAVNDAEDALACAKVARYNDTGDPIR